MFAMRIEGGAELARVLTDLPERVSRSVSIEALTDAGEPMRARMAELAPYEPGSPDLREHIGISATRRRSVLSRGGDQEVAVAIGPTKDFYYGLFQEFGTSRHGAQPFARPAFDQEAPKVLGEIGKRFWTVLASRGIGRSVSAPAVVSSPSGSGLI